MTSEETMPCPDCNREMWTAVPPPAAADAKECLFCPHCQRKNMAEQGRKESQTHELAEALLERGDYGVIIIWQDCAVAVPGEAVKKHACFRFAKGDIIRILGLLARSTAYYAHASLSGDHPIPGAWPADDNDDDGG